MYFHKRLVFAKFQQLLSDVLDSEVIESEPKIVSEKRKQAYHEEPQSQPTHLILNGCSISGDRVIFYDLYG